MLGIYLSGTGNTEHCITKLLGLIDSEAEIIRMTKADEEKIMLLIPCSAISSSRVTALSMLFL